MPDGGFLRPWLFSLPDGVMLVQAKNIPADLLLSIWIVPSGRCPRHTGRAKNGFSLDIGDADRGLAVGIALKIPVAEGKYPDGVLDIGPLEIRNIEGSLADRRDWFPGAPGG